MPTLLDLIEFCRSQARIEAIDYIDPWARGDLRREQTALWRRDTRRRDSARRKCLATFSGRIKAGTDPVAPGRYGRLDVSADGEFDYTVGQYAPVEIYDYLLQYLIETN